MAARTQRVIAAAILRGARVAPGEVAFVVLDETGEATNAVRLRHSWREQPPKVVDKVRELARVVAWARAQVTERHVQIYDAAGRNIGEVGFELDKKGEL